MLAFSCALQALLTIRNNLIGLRYPRGYFYFVAADYA